MDLTIFEARDDDVHVTRQTLQPEVLAELDGTPLEGVTLAERQLGPVTVQLVELAAGGHLVMHSAPALTVCQILAGRGVVGLPHERNVAFAAPEVLVFEPNTRHDWHDIVEDTVLSVCVVAPARA